MNNTHEHQVLTVNASIQPLVITPSPAEGESLPGFILKSAELNGYNSPLKMLHYAGMDDNEARSARPPLAKLAGLYGKSVAELENSGLDGADTNQKGRHLQLMGHAIPFMYTSSKHASICLECVQETGFIDGFPELKYAVACPKHRVRVINTCSACHKPLSWHRPGLMKCSCGAELTEAIPEKLNDPAVLALLGILYCKLMRKPLNQLEIEACGFPFSAIEPLTIQTLLSIIYRFGLFNHKQTGKSNGNDADMMAVKTTAEILSDWPHCFHDYLEKVHAPTANLKVSGLRGQFNSFYESFFKNIAQDNEMQFMRDAFIRFGEERWKQAAIHPKFVSNESAKIVGIYGLAKAMNVQPSTARNMINRGLIKVHSPDIGHSRDVFDVSDQHSFEFAQGKSLSVKKAAEILDIPVDVLRAYRARGYYQARYLAVPIVLYHERDVEVLQLDLMKDRKPLKEAILRQHLTMKQVMQMKTSAEIKAAFIAAVRDMTIVPVGKLSDKPSGLVFHAITTKNYLANLNNKLKGSISFEEAKSQLQIDRGALLALIKANILQCQNHSFGMRIVEESVKAFSYQFITCIEVARMKAMTQKSVIDLCNVLGVSIYQFAQAASINKNMMWVERRQLVLLGINLFQENDYAKAA